MLAKLEKLEMGWVTYVGVRLRRSMDLVSISPLLLRYSRIMPGGWYLSKNLLSFIFEFKLFIF